MVADYTRRPVFRRGTSRVPASYWKGSRAASSIPEDAILTEDGIPIMTEGSEYLLTES